MKLVTFEMADKSKKGLHRFGTLYLNFENIAEVAVVASAAKMCQTH